MSINLHIRCDHLAYISRTYRMSLSSILPPQAAQAEAIQMRQSIQTDPEETKIGQNLNVRAHYENLPMQYTEIFKVVKNENFQ